MIINTFKIYNQLSRYLQKGQAKKFNENETTDFYVTTKGRVFAKNKDRNSAIILNTYVDINGYVKVYVNGKLEYVHRIVALAFIPNPLNLPQVNHKRGTKLGKLDNSVENLEWVTEEENIRHARKYKLNRYARLTEFEKLEIDKMISNDSSVTAYRVSKELGIKYGKVLNYMKRYAS